MFLRWNGYRNMEEHIMELLGLLILLVIISAVVYYLDFQTNIWNAFKSIFETLKKQYVEINQNRRDRAAEKQTRASKEIVDQKEKNRQTFSDWQKIRELEKEREQELRLERANHMSEDYFFQDHVKVHNNGSISVDPEKFLRHPNVQRQLKGMQRLFRHETLRALYKGEEPPQSIGEGCWTKERLKKEWNDEWQADLEQVGLTYEQFFGKPKKLFAGSPKTYLDAGYIKKLYSEIEKLEAKGNTLVLKSKGTSSGGPE